MLACLVRCNELKAAQFHQKGDKYIIRFLSDTDTVLLSAILHADQGEYEEGAVEFWEVRQAVHPEPSDFPRSALPTLRAPLTFPQYDLFWPECRVCALGLERRSSSQLNQTWCSDRENLRTAVLRVTRRIKGCAICCSLGWPCS